MDEKLIITKRSKIKGDDGHRVFSIRIREETVQALDRMAAETNRSSNELINILLDYGIANAEIQ